METFCKLYHTSGQKPIQEFQVLYKLDPKHRDAVLARLQKKCTLGMYIFAKKEYQRKAYVPTLEAPNGPAHFYDHPFWALTLFPPTSQLSPKRDYFMKVAKGPSTCPIKSFLDCYKYLMLEGFRVCSPPLVHTHNGKHGGAFCGPKFHKSLSMPRRPIPTTFSLLKWEYVRDIAYDRVPR